MSKVKRVYSEKMPEFAVKAKELSEEISSYLNINTVTNVRVLIRYDIENITKETYEKALVTAFSSISSTSLSFAIIFHLILLKIFYT